MILDSIIETSVRFGSVLFRWFEQYVVNYFINFGRGFEQIFVMLVVTIFMLITIYILIKRIKKLPKSYVIVVFDCTGRKTILKDLRVKFSTYNTAVSYSQFYHELYGGQYVFQVTRSMNIANDSYDITKADSTMSGYKNDNL
jgi:hypothetical protein